MYLACSHWTPFPIEMLSGSALDLSIVHGGRGKMDLVPWCLGGNRRCASQTENRGKGTGISHSISPLVDPEGDPCSSHVVTFQLPGAQAVFLNFDPQVTRSLGSWVNMPILKSPAKPTE